MSNTEKMAKSWKEYYEKYGEAKVPLCNVCKLIKIEETKWEKPIDGPSISSGMVCHC